MPSLSLLAAFDAVCRSGSTASAARDLALTQGAVSRLIQNLEGQLGVELFRRERNRLIPSDAAVVYGHHIKKALDLIATSSLSLQVNPAGGVLSLAILPTFGTRWLAPRLPEFLALHPGITINLGTRFSPFNFEQEKFDAAIHYGRPDWPGAGYVKLFDERLIACCAPAFQETNPVATPRDIASMPLLHLETRPLAWATWFAQHGCHDLTVRGMLFDQFATILQAAIHGMGVALLPGFLASSELRADRLVPVYGSAISDVGAYYLVWPLERAHYPPIQAFAEWLESETAVLRNSQDADLQIEAERQRDLHSVSRK